MVKCVRCKEETCDRCPDADKFLLAGEKGEVIKRIIDLIYPIPDDFEGYSEEHQGRYLNERKHLLLRGGMGELSLEELCHIEARWLQSEGTLESDQKSA